MSEWWKPPPSSKGPLLTRLADSLHWGRWGMSSCLPLDLANRYLLRSKSQINPKMLMGRQADKQQEPQPVVEPPCRRLPAPSGFTFRKRVKLFMDHKPRSLGLINTRTLETGQDSGAW